MAPAEMADWLERHWDVLDDCERGEEKTMAIVEFIRRQPTDAQKIEALKLAGEAGVVGWCVSCEAAEYESEPWRKNYTRYEPSAGAAHDAATNARAAMRLLGLNPEDEG